MIQCAHLSDSACWTAWITSSLASQMASGGVQLVDAGLAIRLMSPGE
jgi:hypothetical protein